MILKCMQFFLIYVDAYNHKMNAISFRTVVYWFTNCWLATKLFTLQFLSFFIIVISNCSFSYYCTTIVLLLLIHYTIFQNFMFYLTICFYCLRWSIKAHSHEPSYHIHVFRPSYILLYMYIFQLRFKIISKTSLFDKYI